MNIQKYRNKYKNERIFVVCNGPSLNKHDLNKLRTEYTIGCNRIYLGDFIPNFYTVEDSWDVRQFHDEINQFKGPIKFIPSNYSHLIRGDDVVYITFGRHEKGSQTNFEFVSPNRSFFYWGGSVTYLMIQLAYYMGFKDLYLIGADHSWDVKDETKTVKSQSKDTDHFHSDYYGKGKVWNYPNLEAMNNSFQYAEHVSKERGFNIYNATKGGELEIFRRVDYDGLF